MRHQFSLCVCQIGRNADAATFKEHEPSKGIVSVWYGHLIQVHRLVALGAVATLAAEEEVFPASLKFRIQTLRLHVLDFGRMLDPLLAIAAKIPNPVG